MINKTQTIYWIYNLIRAGFSKFERLFKKNMYNSVGIFHKVYSCKFRSGNSVCELDERKCVWSWERVELSRSR